MSLSPFEYAAAAAASDKAVKAQKRELGNPDKFVCVRYTGFDGLTKFDAVDMKLGVISSDIEDSDKLELLAQPLYSSLGSVVFCVGYSFEQDPAKLVCFSFDLNSPDLGWTKAPNVDFSTGSCLSLKDKFYAFTPGFAEVYSPIDLLSSALKSLNGPNPNPNLILNLNLKSSVLILVQIGFYCISSTVASTPTIPIVKSFQRLDRNFPGGSYSPLSVVVDGVIYSHHEGDFPIGAYDFEKRGLLDVIWESECGFGIGDEYLLWAGLLHLGDGILCLGCCDYERIAKSVVVTVVYIKVEAKMGPRGKSILASPQGYHQFIINSSLTHDVAFFPMAAELFPKREEEEDDGVEELDEEEILALLAELSLAPSA